MQAVALAALLLGMAPAAESGDGRRMLSEREAVSWRGVGRVNIAGTRFCTGALIDEQHVLTAAHCVFNPRTGRPVPPDMLHFVAGLRLGRHVGSQKVEAMAILPEYRYGGTATARQVASDVALLRLARPMPPRLAPAFPTGQSATPDSLFIVSYARDRAHAPSIERQCELERRRGVIVTLSCDVRAGASGAPVFRQTDDGAQIVAVVSAQARSDDGPKALAVDVQPALARLRAMLSRVAGTPG